MISIQRIPDAFDFLKRAKQKEEIKQAAIEDAKSKEVPVEEPELSLDTPEGDDILEKKMDPEKALGYQSFESEEDYFNQPINAGADDVIRST